jgi:hypothetical protein
VFGQTVGKRCDLIYDLGARDGGDTAFHLKGLCGAFDRRVVVLRTTVVSF